MLIAIGDSSFLSLPEVNDAALMALSINNPARMWELATMTVIGSIIGCSLLYSVGRRGGEALLARRFAAERVSKIRGWYQKYGVLAVLIPSLLPPPLPFKIFVLAAGAFQISWFQFLLAVGIGRSIRYFGEGLMAVTYGKKAIALVAENSARVGIFLAAAIVAGALVYAYLRRHRAGSRALILMPLLLALGASGCVKTTTIPENQRMLKSFPFTQEQAIAKLQRMSRTIQTIQTGITLTGSTAVLNQDFKRKSAPALGGTLIMENTGQIRLKASYTVFTAFNMVSNGKDYQVWVNRKDGELYQGREDDPPSKPFPHLTDLENQFVSMRPRQIHDALMINVVSLLNDPSIIVTPYTLPVPADRKRYFIVDFTDISSRTQARLVQRFWFDLSTDAIDVVRRQTFDRNGELETDTQFSEHQAVNSGTIRYPLKIDVQLIATDTRLKLSINPEQIRLNEDVSKDAFELEPHEGSQMFKFEPRASGVSQQR